MEKSPDSIDGHQEPHLGAGTLRCVLARGFGAGTGPIRQRALCHLSAGCSGCRQVLEELIRAPADSAGPWDARVRDGVVLGLRHLVELRRGVPGAVAWLRSPHHYWLERAGVEPLAFARVVVEEIRDNVLRLDHNPELTSPLSREALKLITEDPRLEALHPRRFRDLHGLALAYLADDYRVQGRSALAGQHFRLAEKEIARGTADPEVHATLNELRADLDLARGLGIEALSRLEDAARLVRGAAVPGRAAETQVRLGLLWTRLKDIPRAAAACERAQAELAPGIDLGTRLRAGHYLALAAARRRDFGRCLALLEESAELYGDRAPERLRLERLVMLGVSRFETGVADAAEPLRQAVERLRKLGLWHDAAQTLAMLGRVYFATGRPEEAARADAELASLLRSPAARELSRTELRRLRDELAGRLPRTDEPDRDPQLLYFDSFST